MISGKDLGFDGNFNGKRIVELGSGLGVTAATFVHLGASIICTDGEESVVDQLRENLERNFGTDARSTVLDETYCSSHGHFDCVYHRWGESVDSIASSSILKEEITSLQVISPHAK